MAHPGTEREISVGAIGAISNAAALGILIRA